MPSLLQSPRPRVCKSGSNKVMTPVYDLKPQRAKRKEVKWLHAADVIYHYTLECIYYSNLISQFLFVVNYGS